MPFRPMHEALWVGSCESTQVVIRLPLVLAVSLVLVHHPFGEPEIELPPERFHRCSVKAAVVCHPAAKHRIEYVGKIAQALVTFELKMPATHLLVHPLHGHAAHRRQEIDVPSSIF